MKKVKFCQALQHEVADPLKTVFDMWRFLLHPDKWHPQLTVLLSEPVEVLLSVHSHSVQVLGAF